MSHQVLVTGVAGFIAKQVTLELLRDGYHVVGTLRNLDRADEVRRAVDAGGGDSSRLSFAEVDLRTLDGWDDAVRGCDYVQHVASPFPIQQPRDRFALVPDAKQGTLHVLGAAQRVDVQRVVLTSSMVAMMYRANRPTAMIATAIFQRSFPTSA